MVGAGTQYGVSATELMHEPAKVVSMLGGWKDIDTLLTCYQQPDQEAMRAVLARRWQVG